MVVIIIITTITTVKSSRTCSSSTRTGAWRLELLFGCPPTKFTIFKTWPWLWFINYCNHDDDDDDDDEHLSFVIADKHNIVDLTWKGNIWLRSGNFWGIWDHFLKKSGKYIWYGLEKPASKFEIRNSCFVPGSGFSPSAVEIWGSMAISRNWLGYLEHLFIWYQSWVSRFVPKS